VKSPESALDYQHIDWGSVPAEQLAEGIERQMIWGERLMMCRLILQPQVVTAVHSHPHEQMTIVARGRVRFIVDGRDRMASAGDVLLFPANIPHGATMLDEEVELIDIFSPLREDFLPQRPQAR
jgi:quercetin dioxygenase-like cupin family protein